MTETPNVLRAPVVVMLMGAAVLTGCDRPAPTDAGGPSLPGAIAPSHQGGSPFPAVGAFGADVALDWLRLAYVLTRQERLSPPVASRAFAYLGITLYESLVPGTVDYQSLAGQLNGLGVVPTARHGQFHWPVVANAALAAITRRMYGSVASHDAIGNLEAAFLARFQAQIPPGLIVAASKHGQKVAELIHEWSTRDGFAQLRQCPNTAPVGEGLWRPTPPAFLNALEPCWGRMRPFVLPSGSTCDAGPPPAYSSAASSQFFREAAQVYDVVNSLTPEQMAIATFWSDDPGSTGTPPGHSLMIAAQIIEQQALPLDIAAEAFAKVGIATADAFIACWWSKYQYNLLRPITYVHEVLGDIDWTIPLVTPPFPEYTSGHSAQSGATAHVLTDMFGDLAFTDHTHAARGLPSRPARLRAPARRRSSGDRRARAPARPGTRRRFPRRVAGADDPTARAQAVARARDRRRHADQTESDDRLRPIPWWRHHHVAIAPPAVGTPTARHRPGAARANRHLARRVHRCSGRAPERARLQHRCRSRIRG